MQTVHLRIEMNLEEGKELRHDLEFELTRRVALWAVWNVADVGKMVRAYPQGLPSLGDGRGDETLCTS